jgi:hypothetical protein
MLDVRSALRQCILPLVRAQDPGQRPEESRLASPIGSEDNINCWLVDRERNVTEDSGTEISSDNRSARDSDSIRGPWRHRTGLFHSH